MFSRAMARILVSHRCPPPGDPACHTIVLGSRTLRPSRWLDVNVDVIGHNQHGFPLPAHPGATSLDSRCMLPRSALLLPRSLLSLSLTLCFVCYYTCTTLCFALAPKPFYSHFLTLGLLIFSLRVVASRCRYPAC